MCVCVCQVTTQVHSRPLGTGCGALALIAAAFLSFVPVCVRLALWSR